MNEYSQRQFDAFFSAIAGWRDAYRNVRLHYIGVSAESGISLVAARIYLDVAASEPVKAIFRAGRVVAGQWQIPQSVHAVENVVQELVSERGLNIPEVGRLKLESDERQEAFVSPPILLHPEGLNTGSRLAVLTVTGKNFGELVPQPDTDWLLKAADTPYDSLQELCFDYSLGVLRGDKSALEVVARTAVQVLGRSTVVGTQADLGVWMGKGLDRNEVKLGFRLLDNGKVVRRDTVSGPQLTWTEESDALIGTMQMEVPSGAIIQCIASYSGHAQNVQWLADPTIFKNPRAAVFELIDSRGELLRSFLQPEFPLRGKAADDFESGIAWLLWILGFSTAAFGTNAKSTDAFDTVAVTPNGDIAVIETTLALLRADSKLSKLSARAARLREMLARSNMKHIQVLPVIVSAMTADEVKADIPAAEESGILVLTRENIVSALELELSRYPNANDLFARGIAQIEEKQRARLQSRSR